METGARKHLIPGAEAGFFAINHHRQFPAVGGGAAAIGGLNHQSLQFGADRHLYRARHVPDRQPFYFFGAGGEKTSILSAGALCGGFDQLDADENIHREILLGVKLLYDVAAPGKKAVGPGLQRVEMTPLGFDGNSACQRSLSSASMGTSCHRPRRGAMAQNGVEDIMAVGKNVSGDFDRSPMVRLMGKRPQSTSGRTFSMIDSSGEAGLTAPFSAARHVAPLIVAVPLRQLSMCAIPCRRQQDPENVHPKDAPTVQSIE